MSRLHYAVHNIDRQFIIIKLLGVKIPLVFARIENEKIKYLRYKCNVNSYSKCSVVILFSWRNIDHDVA